MRFLADMGISEGTVSFLRSESHNAEHLREQGLQRMADADILQKAPGYVLRASPWRAHEP